MLLCYFAFVFSVSVDLVRLRLSVPVQVID